jgi:hypothetical protein
MADTDTLFKDLINSMYNFPSPYFTVRELLG